MTDVEHKFINIGGWPIERFTALLVLFFIIRKP